MSAQLPNGLWSDFNPQEDGRLKVNANFHQLDWTQWKCITGQLANAGLLPGSPSVGDAYFIASTDVHIWYNSQWNILTPPCAFLFYDQTLNEFFVWIGGVATNLQTYLSASDNTAVGVVNAFNDYGILPLPPKYVWCDGSVVVSPSSLLNGVTTDDMSGLAIVGYGTIGAGDIATSPYDATPVGNVSNQINLQHTHTLIHTHTMVHTHTVGAHNHPLDSSGWARVAAITGGSGDIIIDVTAASSWTSNRRSDSTDQGAGASISEGAELDGSTDNSSSFPSGAASNSTTSAASTATTSSGLSATQNIQPRSKKLRFILKIL